MRKRKGITSINWKQVVLCYIIGFILLTAIGIASNWELVSHDGGKKIGLLIGARGLLLVSLALYSYFADRQTMEETRKVVAMFAAMVFNYGIIALAALWQPYGIYLVPFSMCAIVLSLIVSGRCGFFANFTILLMYFLQTVAWEANPTLSTEHNFYLFFGGVIELVFAAYILLKDYRRFRYVVIGLILGLVSALCAGISYALFQESWNWEDFSIKVGCAFASGIVGVMLMFVLVPLFEKIFRVSSVFRYSEIASSDSELMRKLFEKAPGTFNHSLSVAAYVEACAMAIGQSAVQARAIAYYHDIGKMKSPSYFTENQMDGVNPHDSMTPEASVNMIKMHTANGLAIAKEYGLPKEVQLAIVEHHGTMPLKYFYLKAKKYTDGDLPYDGYCYDGPKPTSKLSAILMICDASEAALRASNDKSKAEKIVDGIVSERLAFEQFSNCDITMKEIEIIKSTIITTYLGIRHERVKYPDVKLEGENK